MKKISTLTILMIAFTVMAINCKKKTEDPCAGVTISVVTSKQDASAGQSNGSITVTSPTGAGVTYSINNGAATSTAQFANLAAGTYTITAKNSNGCSGSTSITIAAADPCAGKNIVVTTPTIVGNIPCGNASGSVTVAASGSTGFQFKLGNGAYQASPTFPGLAAGAFTVFAKDADGCEKSASVTVPDQAAGPLFTAVRTIMNASCVNCHGATAPSGGVSLNTDCSIVQRATRIKVRCVDGSPSFMPQGGQLPAAQKTAITNWFNAGGKFTD